MLSTFGAKQLQHSEGSNLKRTSGEVVRTSYKKGKRRGSCILYLEIYKEDIWNV